MNEAFDAYTIPEFCSQHRFSRQGYYNLPLEDRPDEIRIGKRVLISREAAARWRRLHGAPVEARQGGRVKDENLQAQRRPGGGGADNLPQFDRPDFSPAHPGSATPLRVDLRPP